MKTSNQVRQNGSAPAAAQQVPNLIDVSAAINGAIYTRDALRRNARAAAALLMAQAEDIALGAKANAGWELFDMEDFKGEAFSEGMQTLAKNLASGLSPAFGCFETAVNTMLEEISGHRGKSIFPARDAGFREAQFDSESTQPMESWYRAVRSALRLTGGMLADHAPDEGALDLVNVACEELEGAWNCANGKLQELVGAVTAIRAQRSPLEAARTPYETNRGRHE